MQSVYNIENLSRDLNYFQGCVPLVWSRSGSMIQDHSDPGASKEPRNPCPEWIPRFLWCTRIPLILGYSYRTHPLLCLVSLSRRKWGQLLLGGKHYNFPQFVFRVLLPRRESLLKRKTMIIFAAFKVVILNRSWICCPCLHWSRRQWRVLLFSCSRLLL